MTDYLFRTLSPEGGFYYDGVKSIKQDKQGFIWILMDNDLYRFDGYQHKRYYSCFRQLNTSGEWYFNNLDTDASGNLLVATDNGLFRYNRAADNFEKIFNADILFAAVDGSNNIWIRSKYFGIFDEKNRTVFYPPFKGKAIRGANFFCSPGSQLFTGIAKGKILYYDYLRKQFFPYLTLPGNPSLLTITEREGKLWVLTSGDGLFLIDMASKSIQAHYTFFCQDANEKIPARALLCDRNGNLWIGTQRGLYVFDPVSGKYELYKHSKSDAFSLPDNSVWTIAEDRHRNIWVGTYSGRLSYVDFKQNAGFRSYSFREDELNHNVVSGFAEDNDALWIATEGGGLNRLDKRTGDFSYLCHTKTGNSPAYNNMKSLLIDKQQRLWIAMFRGGLDVYDIKRHVFSNFFPQAGNPRSLLTNSLRKIVPEGDKGLWIAYQYGGPVVAYYSFGTNSFTNYHLTKRSNTSYIFDMARGHGDDLWVATHQCLYLMNIRTHIVRSIPLGTLPSLNAQALFVDNRDNVWIGSIGKGLIRYDRKRSCYYFYPDILKFNVSTIYSICDDDEGNLWMGTDNGLFRYSVSANTFARYDARDGVQGPVFYPLACMKRADGTLCFGGTNGFTIVDPRKLNSNDFRPTAMISGFLIDNIPVTSDSPGSPLKKDDIFTKGLKLSYNQVNFGFTFSCDNFLIPEKNRYKYRLKGYDSRWIEVDAANRSVFFSKVPPGDYTLEVMAANNDGVWSKEPTRLKIHRAAAPWASLFAWFVYLAVAGYLAFIILRYYSRQKRLKMELYLENLEKNKQEEIHQSQLRFFTNVSHDFRTPLSLIIATLDKLKQDGMDNQYFKLLNSNARRLLNLVNELMDFRTVENGKMKLKLAKLDINHLVRELTFDFADYACQHHIGFTVKCDPELKPDLFLDRHIMEKTIVNLLDNAFKYTKDGGSIAIETLNVLTDYISPYNNSFTVGTKDKDKCFCIIIHDTGIGIEEDALPKVFERFYKADNEDLSMRTGTGIGLALVKSLILLHKGSISLYSEKEEGTDIVVSFSKDRGIYDYTDFSTDSAIPDTLEEAADLSSVAVPDKNQLPPEFMQERLALQKKKLLLVEDNKDLRTVIADYLSPHYRIVEAFDGVEASAIMEQSRIDLIISDIMMPRKDGITLCREVKSDVGTSHIPFILLTAKSGIESKIEGTGSGADIYFEKPVDLQLLLLSIQNLFNRQQQLKQYYAQNYFVDSSELSTNEQDNRFLKKLGEIIDSKMEEAEMDVTYIASELSMSRSKLYTKIKTMTDKSIVEFILSYRLRKAARLIAEEDFSMGEVMAQIGIESQSYFTRSFKKEFGETPTAFAAKHRQNNRTN